ncbi:MAG: hypothetical protein ACLUEK_01855 [Oscillospiraceae bacterium]
MLSMIIDAMCAFPTILLGLVFGAIMEGGSIINVLAIGRRARRPSPAHPKHDTYAQKA